MLRKTGADTIRVGLNKGDEIFWGPDNFIAFTQDLTQWPDTFSNIVTKHTITDVVLYGDTRPIHKQAIEIAQARNVTIHVFEEG
jgi:capsular polysaccharide export protein